MKKIIKLIVFVFFLTSCSTIHYRFPQDPNGQGGTEWQHYALWGGVSYSGEVRSRNKCPKGVSSITTRKNPAQAVLSIIPYLDMIWSAREVRIECADASTANNSSSNGGNGSSNGNGNTNNNNNNINININGFKQDDKDN